MRYPIYELGCKNELVGQHTISLPLPKDVTIGGHRPVRAGITVNFACPRCNYVYEYSGVEVQHSYRATEDLRHLPPEPTPVEVEFGCAQAECGGRIRVYTTRDGAEDRKDLLARLAAAVYFVTCPKGHKAIFPGGADCKITEGPRSNPF
ncbi:MAG TPA: hypothetical protein VEG08_01755 [Terriglobales bacterium]|nr:hypothetical protein [Terriglobales bacterium]